MLTPKPKFCCNNDICCSVVNSCELSALVEDNEEAFEVFLLSDFVAITTSDLETLSVLESSSVSSLERMLKSGLDSVALLAF